MFLLTKVVTYSIIASPLVLGYLLLSDFFPENFPGSEGSTDVAPAEYSTDYAPTAEVSDSPRQASQYIIVDITPQQSVWDNKPDAKKSNPNMSASSPWRPSSMSDTAGSNTDFKQQR